MKTISTLLVAMLLVTSCQTRKASDETESKRAEYNEPYRPQYHFTPAAGWMNDPNGLVYYEGEYHLFYQHYPDSTVWGPMHWGHAVSNDLIHWEHLPIALYPDSLGLIFSGSAVMDWNNTSGLGTSENPPMVAIFTNHDMEAERAGHIDYETQGMAFSLDKGRTWTKYAQNPVLPNPGIRDFRDPKVSWNEVSKQWVMALAVTDHIEFYGSDDLKKWNRLSAFGRDIGGHGGVWECPDLFPLKDGEGKMKWVLFVSINPGGPQGGSATQYFIGDFDGQKFTPQDTVTRWIDYGADNYAGVTWSDIPAADGRRLFIGWMSNWQYANVVPTEKWRSATTLPREITLTKSDTKYELKFKPVAELGKILGAPQAFEGDAALDSPLSLIGFDLNEGEQAFSLTISNEKQEKTVLSLDQGILSFDRRTSGVAGFNAVFPAVHQVDLGKLVVYHVSVYMDVASMEIFINDGERVLTEIVFPTVPYNTVQLDKANPAFSVSAISSIWQ